MNSSRPFTWIAAIVFAVIAVAHLVRVFTGFQVTFGTHDIPMWISYVAIVATAFMSWMLCREARGTTGA
jgi:hypothetical protein